mmetsp:Transcript_46386/g.46852  ORF Transcript_46386/g.46852 Transcript_46386/m.46852 type:complete len:85 (+) Transcript_46386:280-534(+)
MSGSCSDRAQFLVSHAACSANSAPALDVDVVKALKRALKNLVLGPRGASKVLISLIGISPAVNFCGLPGSEALLHRFGKKESFS